MPNLLRPRLGPLQHIKPRPDCLRHIGSMHLSGITAEDRPGARGTPSAGKTFGRLRPGLRFPFVELAKGFEPPTL